MQFTTTQQELNRGLSVVGHAVSGRPTRPIEGAILAQTFVEEARVRLSASSEQMGIHCWIGTSEIREEGVSLLPAKLFSDFVSHLPPAPVTVTAPSPTDPTSCHIQCERIRANMKHAAQDPVEFPPIPSYAEGGETVLYLDAELLKQIIAEVVFAAADKDAVMPGLTGVQIEIANGRATVAAVDSFRLAVRSIPLPDEQQRQTLLLPASMMEELAKLLPSEGTVQVVLTPDHHQVVFHTSMMDVSTRLLTMAFPNIHNGIIPEQWTTRAVLSTQELAARLRLMAPFARQARNAIQVQLYGEATESLRLEREPNTVQLEVVAQDVGENQNVINAQVEGPDQAMDVHVDYLSDVLSVMTTPQVALEVINRYRPVVVRPVGGDDYTYVLMPVNFSQTRASAQREEPVSA